MKLQKDLKEFIELLNSHSVLYVIVGGVALAYHGHPRYTGDVDFLIEISESNADRLCAVITDFGFSALDINRQDFLSHGKVIQLGVSPNRIDILTSLTGVSFEEVWRTRVQASLDSIPVSFISRDLLIQNKQKLGRPQDLADVEALIG